MSPHVEIVESSREFRIVAYASRIDNLYAARLPKCGCERTPCVAAYDHGRTVKNAAPGCDGSNRDHCHAGGAGGYHREHVEHLAELVAKTYGAKYRPQRALPGITDYMRSWPKLFLAAPSWPDWSQCRDKPFTPRCDCDSCMGSIARFGTPTERAAVAARYLPERVAAWVEGIDAALVAAHADTDQGVLFAVGSAA